MLPRCKSRHERPHQAGPIPGRPEEKTYGADKTTALRILTTRRGKARAVELLGQFDLAAGLVTRPPVLFLDEPTTGPDRP